MSRNGKNNKGGRPKGTIAKSTARAIEIKEIISQRLREEIGPILDAQIKKAKEGDMPQFKNMLEQVVGKPVESIKLSGDEENPVVVDITSILSKSYGEEKE